MLTIFDSFQNTLRQFIVLPGSNLTLLRIQRGTKSDQGQPKSAWVAGNMPYNLLVLMIRPQLNKFDVSPLTYGKYQVYLIKRSFV